MKSWAEFLALIGDDAADPPSAQDYAQLASALLDAGVPDVELGALIATMRLRADCAGLLAGLTTALCTRTNRLPYADTQLAPIAIGCYDGAWETPNLAPLVGLLLARFGIPVIMHGPLHAHAGVSSAVVLRSFGILPCANMRHAAHEIETRRIAFVPDALIAPGLAALLALRARLGTTAVFSMAARLIGAFDPTTLVLAWANDSKELDMLREVALAQGLRALLLHSARSDTLARITSRPRIEHCRDGESELLFEGDAPAARQGAALPDAGSAAATAMWIQQVYDGAQPLPTPLGSQIAACLYACGYCEDFNQAKAMAALGASQRRVA